MNRLGASTAEMRNSFTRSCILKLVALIQSDNIVEHDIMKLVAVQSRCRYTQFRPDGFLSDSMGKPHL